MGGLVVQYMEWFSGSKNQIKWWIKEACVNDGFRSVIYFFNSKLNIIWKVVGGKIVRD
jgi:hypothetical protein